MSNAASAYARVAQTTAAPRDIEAQALLKAARQLEEVKANWNGADKRLLAALHFNRQLWSIFMSAAGNAENQQTLEIRQNIANIGIFVMNQTLDMQVNPEPSKLNSLIEINCNIAAGLSGRA
jgi:flagellar protein FlaF